jgi:hypothetical protein
MVVMAGNEDLKCKVGFKLWYEQWIGKVQKKSTLDPAGQKPKTLYSKRLLPYPWTGRFYTKHVNVNHPYQFTKSVFQKVLILRSVYDASSYSLWWPSWPLLRKAHRIHFWGAITHLADSITPNDSVFISAIASKGDLQLNVESEPQQQPDILYIPKVKAEQSEERNSLRNLTGDQTQKPPKMRAQYLTQRPLSPHNMLSYQPVKPLCNLISQFIKFRKPGTGYDLAQTVTPFPKR